MPSVERIVTQLADAFQGSLTGSCTAISRSIRGVGADRADDGVIVWKDAVGKVAVRSGAV